MPVTDAFRISEQSATSATELLGKDAAAVMVINDTDADGKQKTVQSLKQTPVTIFTPHVTYVHAAAPCQTIWLTRTASKLAVWTYAWWFLDAAAFAASIQCR
jgi:hypothetical protein